MGTRRTGPLIFLVALGAALLVARLYQVQVLEHRLWAEEAQKLLRTGTLLPFERGAILAREDERLVADTVRYQVELEYREFRRAHPLALVAHGRAALLLQDVTLWEAREQLLPWARELVSLRPADLRSFARGGGLDVGSVHIAPTADPALERRASRASDLRFYAQRLLNLSRAELRALRAVENDASYRGSYLEWTAGHRGQSPAAELQQKERGWLESVEHLALLARELDRSAEVRRADSLGAWLGELENWRVAVDQAAAGRLFAEVAGFRAGRVEPGLLLQWVDLSWLAAEMRWGPAEVREFAVSQREHWLRSWRDGWLLPRLLAELRLAPDGDVDADRVFSTLTALYRGPEALTAALSGQPVDWRADGPLLPLDDLARSFQLPTRAQVADPRRPVFWREDGFVQASERESQGPDPSAPWELLARASGPAAEPLLAEWIAELGAESFRRNFGGHLAGLWRVGLASSYRHRASNRERIQRAATVLLDHLEADFQARLGERLDDLAQAAGAPDSRLRFSEERLDRLGERARHLIKDHGSRRAVLSQDPSYDVVFLLTREPARFPGFVVRTARDRKGDGASGGGPPPAAELLGQVAGVDAELVQRQAERVAAFRVLRAKANRTEEENRTLRALMGELLFAGDQRGVSGLEGYADGVLRGQNGYRERLGLEDVFGRGAHAVQLAPVVDGRDLRLTLSVPLQRAAERVINRPATPPAHVPADYGWLRDPVGAIVLLSAQGEVLSAASAPNASWPPGPEAEGQRARLLERTLSQPGFQPIGSVFKPFVALYALEHRADPLQAGRFEHVCEAPQGADHAEYGGVRCHSRFGHGPVNLARALEVSCNTYFAHLADLLSSKDMERLSRAAGFGEASGVEDLGPGRLRLETVPRILLYEPRQDLALQMRRAANGLQVLDGTPMQVARAFHALATGSLWDLTLIRGVGEQILPQPAPRPLPYSRSTQAQVRAALVQVTTGREGSAREALDPRTLGWTVAAKTGSADLASRRAADDLPEGDSRQPKHTWIAGWLPAEDPKLVFCVFVHDTIATASQSAAWIARQLLETEEVQRYLESVGAPRAVVEPAQHPGPGGAESRGSGASAGGVR